MAEIKLFHAFEMSWPTDFRSAKAAMLRSRETSSSCFANIAFVQCAVRLWEDNFPAHHLLRATAALHVCI